MAEEPLLPGITSSRVETHRLTLRVLSSGPPDGEPVVFIHGNLTSSVFWEDTMLNLPAQYHVLAPDLRSFGGTDPVPVDATHGMRDWSDDIHALVETLALPAFHLVGWSLGAGVAMQYAIDHPGNVRSLTLESPLSPYGFGGTKDAAGTPAFPDFAGSGGGVTNSEFVQRLKDGDRGEDSPASPRRMMNDYCFKPPFRVKSKCEEAFVTATIATHVGDGFYPGDKAASNNWPGVAPGKTGVNNAISPRYCDLSGFAAAAGPPVLWVRGADDQVISDNSAFCFGVLGKQRVVPDWPGDEVYPPQPMVAQMRAVLDRYQANGGHYREIVISDCGHSPHIEKPDEFLALLLEQLDSAGRNETWTARCHQINQQ